MKDDIFEYILNKCKGIDIIELPKLWNGDFSFLSNDKYIDINLIEDNLKLSIQEHIFGLYTMRLIKEDKVSIETIQIVLNVWGYNEFESNFIIKNFLGELAMYNKLQNIELFNQYQNKYLDEDDWAYKQIHIRKLMLILHNFDLDFVNEIIKNKTIWAFYEIIPKLSESNLNYLKERLNDKNFLTKIHRYELREYFKRNKY